jgi:hypothetical protein
VPLDTSRPKGWGFYNPKLQLTEYFCPRCDVALLTLEDYLSPGRGLQDLLWKRVGGQLTPCQPDEEGLIKLNRKMWEVRKTMLFYHVASFVYFRSRPLSLLSCPNDGGEVPVFGLIPYEDGSWIALAWCVCCKLGLGAFSDKDYGWGWYGGFTFRLDVEEESYRVSPTNSLNVGSIEYSLNTLIVTNRHGVPTGVNSVAGQMEIEDVPDPGELPASLWDGWMTGFKPGVLSGERDWRD